MDPDLSEAGLGEPRPLARASAPGPVTIFQAPETPRSAVMQIAEIIRASGERAVELRLQPEELGRLQLTMSQDASGTLSVALTAERPETLDLLRRNIELLGAELRELGYESIEFSFQGDGAPDKESLETSENGTRDTADTDNRAGENLNGNPTRDGRRSASGDSIDIRL